MTGRKFLDGKGSFASVIRVGDGLGGIVRSLDVVKHRLPDIEAEAEAFKDRVAGRIS